MMKTIAVTAEYNPFHLGHAYQLQKARETLCADCIIILMSGNFVQRGEPAVFDKYLRAEAALRGGADIVLEIPPLFAVSSAREFARASVAMMLSAGIVDDMIFGTEGGVSIEELGEYVRKLRALEEDEASRRMLRELLKGGSSYPAAVAKLIQADEGMAISLPNNILAAEYLSALIDMDPAGTVTPHALARLGAPYEEQSLPEHGYASAAALRELIFLSAEDSDSALFLSGRLSDFVPKEAAALYMDALSSACAVHPDSLGSLLSLRLLDAQREGKRLDHLLDVSREISDRLMGSADRVMSFEERARFIKTRQYTLTRVKRALLHIVLCITDEEAEKRKEAGYITHMRLLGFRQKAADLGWLRLLKDRAKVPLITKNADHRELIAGDVFADQIYYSLSGGPGEYERSPVVVTN